MIIRQRNAGIFLGMAKIVIGQVSPYINWFSFALVGLMTYYTTVSPIFAGWGIILPFWAFILVLIFIAGMVILVEWMFLLPSYFGASNVQTWESENPQRVKLEKLENDIAEIKEMLRDRNV